MTDPREETESSARPGAPDGPDTETGGEPRVDVDPGLDDAPPTTERNLGNAEPAWGADAQATVNPTGEATFPGISDDAHLPLDGSRTPSPTLPAEADGREAGGGAASRRSSGPAGSARPEEDGPRNEEATLGEEDAPGTPARAHLRGLLEALVFVSDKPIRAADLAKATAAPLKEVKELLAALKDEYAPRGIQLDEVAGGWLFRTSAACAPFVRDLTKQRPVKLTRAQLEALAILAYRQPITRPEIDEIRGVDSGPVLKLLLERDLVRILGKKDEPGRPLLYGTTQAFLEFFGLRSLRDLPTLREFTELNEDSRRVVERELGDDLDGRQPEETGAPAAEDLGATERPDAVEGDDDTQGTRLPADAMPPHDSELRGRGDAHRAEHAQRAQPSDEASVVGDTGEQGGEL